MVRTLLLILLLQGGLVRPVFAEDRGLLILYPETANPYRKVYEQIIDGIRTTNQDSLRAKTLPRNYNIKNIRRWLEEYKSSANTLVVLGSRALNAVGAVGSPLPFVAGAVDILPGKDSIPGVSIRIHPRDYLSHLRLLSPDSTNLIVFYLEDDKALIPLIETEAHKRGVSVNSVPVINTAGAIRSIAAVLNEADPTNTAIWFTRDVIELNTELLYPYVLEESWKRRIPVFSGMISHTKRGFLFSLYPDYEGMGEALGRRIAVSTSGRRVFQAEFCPVVKFALNTRTVQHLGLTPSETVLKNVDLTFPAWQTTD
jgi:putative ABC transport system substrate-binding protein